MIYIYIEREREGEREREREREIECEREKERGGSVAPTSSEASPCRRGVRLTHRFTGRGGIGSETYNLLTSMVSSLQFSLEQDSSKECEVPRWLAFGRGHLDFAVGGERQQQKLLGVVVPADTGIVTVDTKSW